MRGLLIATIAAAMLTLNPVVRGQPSAVEPVTPPQTTINLTVEQRHTIKELMKDSTAPKVAGDFSVDIGSVVPPTVTLRPMPADVAAKVPQVKSHEFFLMDNRIVLVSPKDKKVADVIQ